MVVCAMSRLPLTFLEETVLIAVMPNNLFLNKELIVNGLFSPSLLPIIGLYNEYGSIKYIKRDINVEFLEKKYNKPIEEIVETITSNRDIFDSYGNIHKIWDLQIFKNPELNDFFELGFEKLIYKKQVILFNKKENIYLSNIKNKDFEIDKEYILIYFENNVKIKKIISHINIQKSIYQETNIILGLKNNDSALLKELNKMYPTFFNKKIYDSMSSVNFEQFKKISKLNNILNSTRVVEAHLMKLGFVKSKNIFIKNDLEIELFDYKKNILKNKNIKFETIEEFFNIEEIKKENLNINLIKDLYGIYLKLYLDLINIMGNIELSNKESKEFVDKFTLILKNRFKNLLSMNLNNYLVNMYCDILFELLLNNKKNKFIEFCNIIDNLKRFEKSMIATNNIFIPTYAAYKEDSLPMNKYLNKIISSVKKNNENN